MALALGFRFGSAGRKIAWRCAGEIDEFAFVSALRDGDVNTRGSTAFSGKLIAEGFF